MAVSNLEVTINVRKKPWFKACFIIAKILTMIGFNEDRLAKLLANYCMDIEVGPAHPSR